MFAVLVETLSRLEFVADNEVETPVRLVETFVCVETVDDSDVEILAWLELVVDRLLERLVTFELVVDSEVETPVRLVETLPRLVDWPAKEVD